MKTQISRRRFLGVGAAAAAVSAFPVPSLVSARGINDKVSLAAIGSGVRCSQVMGDFKNTGMVTFAGFADPDLGRAKNAAKRFDCSRAVTDFRTLLDDSSVDATVVTTPNHWHCLAAILSMAAGKDVYVEKPLSHSQWEGQQVVNASRKYDRICQMGNQQYSDPMQNEIKKFLHADKELGAIQSVRVNHYSVRQPIGKRETPMTIPSAVDYNLWLGPAQDLPLYRNSFHYDWHWMWNTGSGEMGNWGVHVLGDALNNGLLNCKTLPKAFMGGGARVVYNDAGETPNMHFVSFETETVPVVLGLSNVPLEKGVKAAGIFEGPRNGYIVFCEGGQLEGQRGSAVAKDKDGAVVCSFKGNSGNVVHQKNFLDALIAHDRTIQNSEIALGNCVTGWCNLANIAFRIGKPFTYQAADFYKNNTCGMWTTLLERMESQFGNYGLSLEKDAVLSPVLTVDQATGRFTGEGAEQANALLKREYRKGFEVPDCSV